MIAEIREDIDEILREIGVPLLDERGRLIMGKRR